MRISSLLAGFVVALGLATGAVAQDQIKTTTEFGVTITPENITDAIQEQQDFWGPVRHYIGTAAFDGDPAIKADAVAFLKTVHGELQSRLFERDEATAQDLLEYLTMRLRKFALYRQLRGVINDDAAMVALVERWEKAHREINALAIAERPARVQAILALMPDEMAAFGISAEAVKQATPIWDLHAQCIARMSQTEAGKMMIDYERQAKQLDRRVGELVRLIAMAADWALVVKSGNEGIGRTNFEKAWKDLADLRAKALTAAKPVERK
jgi:hypothetical protein